MPRFTTVLAALILVLLTTPLPAADAPPAAKPPTPTPAAPADATPDPVAAAAQAVYDELDKAARDAAPNAPRPAPEELYQWSKRIDLGAEWGPHLHRMRQRLADEEARHARGQSPRANVLAYRYFVAEAEAAAKQFADHMKGVERLRDAMKDQLPPATPPKR